MLLIDRTFHEDPKTEKSFEIEMSQKDNFNFSLKCLWNGS